jgi:hypothetical protein
MIPRAAQKPLHRWIELNHVTPRQPSASSSSVNAAALRERRDSGASVKDLVETFEKMEKSTSAEREAQKKLERKRSQSIRSWNEERDPKSKPVWKP